MRTVTKDVKALTPVEFRACLRANYGPALGYMYDELKLCREKEQYQGFVIMLWDGPHDTIKNMHAWALLTPTRTYGCVAGTRHNKRVSKYTAQFWVKTQHRRKGLGKRLMREVYKYDQNPYVFPHSKESAKLFSPYRVTASASSRNEWLKKSA